MNPKDKEVQQWAKRNEVHKCPAGVMKAFKGQVVRMLRHPCGSRVINELYTAASTKQRRALCAEFYGREAVLFHEASNLITLSGFPMAKSVIAGSW